MPYHEGHRHQRTILLADVDAFETQVWIKNKYPELDGKDVPIVVVNPDGIMLSVNHVARRWGVVRKPGARAIDEAKILCPPLLVITCGTKEGLVDSDTPLQESDEIISALKDYQCTLNRSDKGVIQRSSRDEFYIDVTDLVSNIDASDEHRILKLKQLTKARKQLADNHFIGNPLAIMEVKKGVVSGQNLNEWIWTGFREVSYFCEREDTTLVWGAIVAQEMMAFIKLRTGYDVSFGVAHNKLAAKLACSENKPQGITVLLDAAIPRLVKTLKFQELPGFKGKIGNQLSSEYERRTGKKLVTLQDVQRVGRGNLVRLLKGACIPDPVSKANDLMNKSYLWDEEKVEGRLYADTVTLAMPFKWPNVPYSWKKFKERIAVLPRLFEDKILYRVEFHGIFYTKCCVKAVLKPRARRFNHVVSNQTDTERFLTEEDDLYYFVLRYIRDNKLAFEDISQIILTGSKPVLARLIRK